MLARKKFATVGWARATTKQQVQAFFANTPIHTFQGKPGEAHRVFLFSAELFSEAQSGKPWASVTELGSAADIFLDWMLTQTGPNDVLMVCDGRSTAHRRKIEAKFDYARHQHEVWIVYRPARRLGRRVAYAADNKEVVVVSMPLNRTQIAAAMREDQFTQAGEESTHETTYTGVDPAPWGTLPLMAVTEKAKVMGADPATPQGDIFDTGVGMPLFWQERKTVQCWKTLLRDVNAKAVFDLTPGSGACARAAMSAGLTYACMVGSAEHCSWLQNILDRQALRFICEANGPLHQQDLAQCIQEHFAETLEQLNQQDSVPETEHDDAGS